MYVLLCSYAIHVTDLLADVSAHDKIIKNILLLLLLSVFPVSKKYQNQINYYLYINEIIEELWTF
jgi:hypothetical protein